MAASPRIWAVTRAYHPVKTGAAIQNHRILSGLIKRGYQVTVLAAGDRAAKNLGGQEQSLDDVTIMYLSVMQIRNWQRVVRFGKLARLLNLINALLSQLSISVISAWIIFRKGQSGDIVQSISCTPFLFIVFWAARIRGMHPVIRLTLWGSDDPYSVLRRIRKGHVLDVGTMQAFRMADAVIGLSSALIDSCHKAGLDPNRIHQIPVGVDVDLIKPVSSDEKKRLRNKLGLSHEKQYIIFVGSAIYRKGIDTLVEAFLRTIEHCPNTDLLILGRYEFSQISDLPSDQQLVKNLQNTIGQAGFSDSVHWLGHVENVSEFLGAADVFCLPTRREGLPNVVGEAMAAGLPVVAARLEGITTDLIAGEQEGILIEGNDPDAYCMALVDLLKHPERAANMGRKARIRAETAFSLEYVQSQYVQLYAMLDSAKNGVERDF